MNWSARVPTNIIAAGFCMNNSGIMDCKTAWPSSSQWTISGNNLIYNTGNISTANFVKAGGFCIGSDCITSWPFGGGGSQWTTLGSDIYYSSGGVGIGGVSSADQLYIASTKGGAQNAAIRAVYPAGGGLLNTEFAALAYRSNVWSAVYGKQGSATYAGYFEGNALVTGTLNAGSLCINGNCKTAWPSSGTTLPGCADGSYLKMVSGAWSCVTDLNKYWKNKGSTNTIYVQNGVFYVCYGGAWTQITTPFCTVDTQCTSATGSACAGTFIYSSNTANINVCGALRTLSTSSSNPTLYICQ
jgi:hypothetical protein